jgi:hypothetical protein
MALKDVLVYLDQSEHEFERLRLAAARSDVILDLVPFG